MKRKSERCFYCPFCKKTKPGRPKALAYYEILYHVKAEHISEHIIVHGKVMWAEELIKNLCTLDEFGVFKK